MNAIRISFLVVIDVLVVAILVSLLSGCVATAQRGRNGDFVSHIASTEAGARATTASAPLSAPRAQPTERAAPASAPS